MGNTTEKIVFLDHEYIFPTDIQMYIDLLAETDGIQQRLMTAFTHELNASPVNCVDTKDLHNSMQEQAKVFISHLCDQGIFNLSIDDFIYSNDGYKAIEEVNTNAVRAMSQFLAEEIGNFASGLQSASQSASSIITGTGVQVFSSSALTLAATSAIEYSVLSGQCKKADALYRSELDRISNLGASRRERQEREYIQATYLPSMINATTLFAYTMMDKYLRELIRAEKFNQDVLKFVDIKKSQSLLQNINLTPNKKAVLQNSFLACPFNSGVYDAVIQNNLLDDDTLHAAEFFKQSSHISSMQRKIQLEAEIKMLRTKESELIQSQRCMEREIAPVEKNKYEIEATISRNNSAIRNLEKRIFGKKKAQEVIKSLTEQNNSLHDDLSQIRKTLEDIKGPLDKVDGELLSVRESIRQIESEMATLSL